MLQLFDYLRSRPLLLSALGWALLPGMYILVSVLDIVGMDVGFAFSLVAPLGLIGIACWCLAIFYGVKHLVSNTYRIVALLALVTAAIPLAFLILAILASFMGS
jgi:hypothetical protein